MNQFEGALRIFLPVYFLIFLWIGFIWRLLKVRREIGKTPLIPGDSESAHGFITEVGKVLVLALAAVVTCYTAAPGLYSRLGPIAYLEALTPLRLGGVALLLGSLALIWIAQVQMGASWRVGIETTEKTRLVNQGLYLRSRNPIYVALVMNNLGLFLALPSFTSLVIGISAWIQLQTLVRLEEAHMRALHGADYDSYCRLVRRWL